MPSKSPRSGDLGRCRSPTTPATTAWTRSPPRILAARAAALCARGTFDGRLHRAHDGASGARARVASSPCSTPRRGPKRRSRASGASRRSRSPKPGGSPRSRRCSFQSSSIATASMTRQLRAARADHGGGNRRGGLPAPAEGDHDAARHAAAAGRRSRVRRWCWSAMATNSRRRRCRGDRRRHRRIAARRRSRIADTSRPWSGRKR